MVDRRPMLDLLLPPSFDRGDRVRVGHEGSNNYGWPEDLQNTLPDCSGLWTVLSRLGAREVRDRLHPCVAERVIVVGGQRFRPRSRPGAATLQVVGP